MKFLCAACERLVTAGPPTRRGGSLVLVCPACAAESALPGPEPQTATAGPRPAPAARAEGCPKCGARRRPGRESCEKCGVVFALFKPEALALPDEIEVLWAAAEADWVDEGRHEAFASACTSAGRLPEAVRRYRLRLADAPDDAVLLRRLDDLVRRLLALNTDLALVPEREGLAASGRRARLAFALVAAALVAALLGWALWTTLAPGGR